jgi:hypothetical protein
MYHVVFPWFSRTRRARPESAQVEPSPGRSSKNSVPPSLPPLAETSSGGDTAVPPDFPIDRKAAPGRAAPVCWVLKMCHRDATGVSHQPKGNIT